MSSHELVEVKLKEYGFSFFVMKLPEDEVEDKLVFASSGTGLICRMEYQNFLFVEFVMNLERLFHFVSEQTGGAPEAMITLRHQIAALVYEVNPTLNPTGLVLTKSGIIKPKSKWEGTLLPEGLDWGRVIPEINPYVIIEELEIIGSPGDVVPLDNSDIFFGDSSDLVEISWSRLGIDLEIRKYTTDDLPEIFGPGIDLTKELHYKLHVVQKCLLKAEAVFALCDATGTTDLVSVDTIISELYALCIEVNPFLKVEEIDLEELRKAKRTSRGRRKASKQGKYQKKKDSGKKFKDITKTELLTLAQRMKMKVIGQGEAIDKIVDTIQIASCGLRNPDLPIAVYLLCGTTGVGKTHTSKVLAEELCGSRDNIVRIDCSEYTEQHDVQKLIGAPPSYVGYEDGGFLTNAVQNNPFSIVLFDEIEKAHSKLFDLLLQIMDDARLTDGKGVVTNFKNCIILMTSNIGVAESEAVTKTMGFGDSSLLTDDRIKSALKEALKKRFRPEFLNRIDDTVRFSPLSKEDALRVVSLLLDKVKGYLKLKNITAEFSSNVLSMVFDKGFSRKFGARPLQRTIDKEIIRPLAKLILSDDIKEGMKVKIDFKKNKICVKEVKPRVSRKVPAAVFSKG